MRLNFEVNVMLVDRDFRRAVANMRKADFSRATPVDECEYLDTPYLRRVAMDLARLFGPIL